MASIAQAASIEQLALCFARRPILAKDEKVLGYELLFHEASDSAKPNQTIVDALNNIGLDVACNGHLAFIPCTQEMLLQDVFLALPFDKIVIEIQPDIPLNPPMIEAYERHHQKGYKIAIDKFSKGDNREQLLPLASVVKIDCESDYSQFALYKGKPYKLLA
ncbi:MAG TPA: hypothetical protein VLK33_17930, partial [Terriglobales bacterium]|nr:hypothetical protein [Terriglobales bacterium]